MNEGACERLAERPSAAERKLRHGYQLLEELGETSRRSTNAGMLGDALYAQGRSAPSATLVVMVLPEGGSGVIPEGVPQASFV